MSLVVLAARVARRTLDVLLVLLIGLVLVALVIARLVPVITGGQAFVVGGGSMEPSIPLGSAVVAIPVDAADLAVDDVVSLRVGPQRVVFTHRITRLVPRDDGLWLATWGDGNEDPDPSLVPASAVIGRVDHFVPWAGYLIALLGSLSGVGFVLGLGGCMLAGAWWLEALEDDLRARRRATTLVPGSVT